jgi:FkbM family methyltransferase
MDEPTIIPRRAPKRSRWQRLAGRARSAACLLRGAQGSSRLKLAGYLAWDLLHQTLRVPIRRSEMDLRLSDLSVRVQTFSSQLGAYADIFHLGEYERIPGFASAPGEVVIDAGANVGFFALRHAALVGSTGRVYAFEPNAAVFRLLVHNVQRNRLAHVRCCHSALSDHSGTVRFSASARASSLGHIAAGDEEGVTVQSVTLDDLVERESLERIDLLKMDVEGHEPHVIRGGLARALPITRRVVMESHLTRDIVWQMLEPLGFEKVYDGFWPNVVYFARKEA